ncbi:hypothetical protein FHT44_003106 [Mycolicibacterium sp. BK634]|uniref:hypothetical protein n=1 Tax=Mycolicibacterium sp. BK634 TaxID=2587099 RepID=UPI001619978B|nr:hypothetical protein [Mycolicibacterium sp. BK634]MBB3750611.1 hypothetical protein [Mycolicibacterium sp. BK634]
MKLERRYSAAGFAALTLNVLGLEFLVWVVMVTAWFLLPIVALPALVIDALTAWALTRRGGTAAQVGRGMLIGCLAPILTMLIFIPGWIITRNLGR